MVPEKRFAYPMNRRNLNHINALRFLQVFELDHAYSQRGVAAVL